MKKYIEQLLEDLQAAYHSEEGVTQVELNEQTFEAHMEEVENWVSGNLPHSSFAGQSNLDPSRFPPPDQLSGEEMEAVISGIEGLFGSWNNSIDFPDGIPIPFRYKLAVSLMAEDAFYMSSGMIHHDFCTGYAPDCELGEYCPCKVHWKDV